MSEYERWEPETPFTELEEQQYDGFGGEFEYEEETSPRLAVLSHAPVALRSAPAAAPAPQAAVPPAGGRVGSTAKLLAGQMFVKIDGQKSGQFDGNVSQKGREGWISGSGFSSEVKSPRDVASGLPTGKRQHVPVTLTLPWSSASPQLFNALVTNELLKTVTIEFPAAQADGRSVVAQRVTLTNAAIADLRRVNDRSQVNDGGPVDIVSITFQKIEIEDLLGAKIGMDDWNAPVTELEQPASEDWIAETYGLEDSGTG